MWHTKMHFSAKCNFVRIAIQWFHIKHYSDYQYTKFQPYTFRVQKMCVFARYATLVPRLIAVDWDVKHQTKQIHFQRALTQNKCITVTVHCMLSHAAYHS